MRWRIGSRAGGKPTKRDKATTQRWCPSCPYRKTKPLPRQRTNWLWLCRVRRNRYSDTRSVPTPNPGSRTQRSDSWLTLVRRRKHKRNLAKRSARKDRVKWIHDQLTADPDATHSSVWNVVKSQKKGFQGKTTHLIVKKQTHTMVQNARGF